ncbi:uncharacterized protein HMPREF1541_09496 [Cyphellophora europaea CBS 101466]|uniref:Phytocyanin domain-containing protein n=1 Tax=Cyphellophora europaea (strain CBS 101466) TaxID=1220924 RepID=W2SCA5_CYPE1|nr:uncharacterized protein HMPREF1541_09496 [Cyphellophora europaea CBS 101466]ETN45663.1 hypothetical protein HMPREF1541_09496 [Cyphellophora europaea CBS 101466]
MRSFILAAATFAVIAYADDSSSTSTSSTATTGTPATYTHEVKVGSNGLNFDPDALTASPGDLINFHFYASNHSVAQSSFDKPCQPIDGSSGIFTGFFTASGKDEASQMFSMRLNGTDPMWLYCSSGEHCKGGQSMVINSVSGSDQTLKQYKENAKKADVKSPDAVNGGVVHDKPTSSSTSVSASASETRKSAANNSAGPASNVALILAAAGLMLLL